MALSFICSHLSYMNLNFSENLAKILLSGISKSNYEEVKPYNDVIGFYLNINDIYL